MTSLTAATDQKPLAADVYERILAIGSIMLFVLTAIAVIRGRAEWGKIPPLVWVHLLTVSLAVALTPVMLLRKRGDRFHRVAGWAWSIAMFATAVITLFVRVIIPGHLSPIHGLSVLTIAAVPLLVWRARQHRVDLHRRSVRILITAGLLVAGTLAFPFGRLLGQWLLG